ncbi:YeeE/YedE family protein [Methylobacterium sp. J-076]|uniref:YeeE/YedE family protein n=1 Tax=Methylobacterium sp. J-076 TaxID=2836655 RepID=UPI001FB9B66C|nr:YeeE/YedE family protein [Methylobacterium sp. J-076]MCJ2014751.1 YeeE/YedE family protein [Methylobacterium sp. J-076]
MNAPRLLAAFGSGLLFGLGLALSGMMDPGRVLGFLDVAGAWDPSLAFVLAGAVAVSALGYALRGRMARPALAPRFEVPTNRSVDARLLVGAVLFGIGWGLAGFCPGPALAGLTLGLPEVALFVAAMLAGMLLYRFTAERAPAVGP